MKKNSVALGIETSCDETAVAVVRDHRVLSNVVASSMQLHQKYGGVVPEIATRYHAQVIGSCYREALATAGFSINDLDLIAVTHGPGLIGALLVGIAFAKGLGIASRLPVIGVDHVMAHLWANYLTGRGPKLPFIGLVVSGGHTSIIEVNGPRRFTVVGQTQDDAVGEAFDKVARILGLGYPGGPAIEKRALRCTGKKTVSFPLFSPKDRSADFSFSGIKTSVLYHVKKRGGAARLSVEEIDEIAAVFQDAVCSDLTQRTVRVCRERGVRDLVVGGGVSANACLRNKLATAAAENRLRLSIPPLGLCLDNGAMTAVLGTWLFKEGAITDRFLSGYTNFDAGMAAHAGC